MPVKKTARKPSSKTKVLLIYGGRSGEHDISLVSAASVFRKLDRNRFEVIPLGIDLQGRWWLTQELVKRVFNERSQFLPLETRSFGAQAAKWKQAARVDLSPAAPKGRPQLQFEKAPTKWAHLEFDVIFPVMHGPLCEDGAIQGLFELADIPFVGCGVLASALGMDKEVAKRIVRDAGLPVVPYLTFKKRIWTQRTAELAKEIGRQLGFPCFVKPATLGSSVGVSKVKADSELNAAIEKAFLYDEKVLIEKAINAREIEFAVLEDRQNPLTPRVSPPGEIIPRHEFYSFEAKYVDEKGADLQLPAELSPLQRTEGQRIASQAFQALECEGLARVDLFLDRKSGAFYFNEVNTLPGFTSISMYPKMMEASGMPYVELLTHLVDLALDRASRKTKLVREFHHQK